MKKTSHTILIVDDSVEDVALYRRYLLHDPDHSYVILEATSGAEGLMLWNQHHPDILLLDYRLPDLDGLQFVAELTTPGLLPCLLPVIMLTGQGNEMIAVQAMKAGIQDYLVKGQITQQGLQLVVNKTIAKIEIHTQMQQGLKRELLSYQIAQKIHQSLDLDEILKTTVAEVRQFLQIDQAVILRFQANDCATVMTESVDADWNGLLSTDLCFTQDYIDSFRQGLVILEPDRSSTPFDGEQLQERASMMVPILQNGLLWGVLIVHHYTRTHLWEVVEVDLLKQLAIQVGIGLQQAQLYQLAQAEIAHRKRVEAQLRRSEECYRTLFESLDEGFCMIKVLFDEKNKPFDYCFLETNPAFEKQTGLRDVQGKRVLELIPDLEQYWADVYGKVALTGEPIRFTQYVRGLGKWYDAYAFQINLPEPQTVAILFKDVTERHLAQQQREQLLAQAQFAQAEAERMNSIKDQFLAILSHELRTPLNPILGWAKLLQTRTLSSEKISEALKTIERNAEMQSRLIDDLLDMATVLNGKLSLEMVPVNFVSVIESALDTIMPAALAKSISVRVSSMEAINVMGDVTRLQQLVWNLLSNSIKFTRHHGKVDIRLEQVDNQAKLTVTDNGKGINPDFLPHIFDSFWQEDTSSTRRYGGLGLGLAIVRQLVEAHGGTIIAHSQGEELGATFTVCLPLLRVKPQIDNASEISEVAFDLTGFRVLVVDDDLDTCEMLQILLTQYGAEVTSATSAMQALARLEAFKPDILLSDIGMPEINGHTLIQQIRHLPSPQSANILAIALSAYSKPEDHQRALNNGFNCQINKPFQIEELLKTVVRLACPQRK